jgi:hypothetical protein
MFLDTPAVKSPMLNPGANQQRHKHRDVVFFRQNARMVWLVLCSGVVAIGLMAPSRENWRRWELNRSCNDERFGSLERRCVAQFKLLCRRNKSAVTLSERACCVCELYPDPDPYSPCGWPRGGTRPTQNFSRHSSIRYAFVVISVKLLELLMSSRWECFPSTQL